MKSLVLSAIFLCSVVFICLAADLSGNWKSTLKMPDGDLAVTCKFKADGEKLTGVVISSYGELPVINGKISGTDFTFTVQFDQNIIPNKGKFYGDSIIIESEIQGQPVKATYKRVP